MASRESDIEVKISYLTQLIFWLNAALDTGKYQDVTVEEVSERVDDGTIFPYLRERLSDAGVMRPSFGEEAATEITAAMQSLLDANGSEVDNNGLSALIGWSNMMILHGAGDKVLRLPWSRR